MDLKKMQPSKSLPKNNRKLNLDFLNPSTTNPHFFIQQKQKSSPSSLNEDFLFFFNSFFLFSNKTPSLSIEDENPNRTCFKEKLFFPRPKLSLDLGSTFSSSPFFSSFGVESIKMLLRQIFFLLFRLKKMVFSLKFLLFLIFIYTSLFQILVSAQQEQQQQENDKDEKLPPDRFYDEDFLSNNWVYNRNVTCGKKTKGVFPSRTWTCANIRVNGRKIAYGHYPFKSGYPYPVGRCFETQGRDDMGGICLGLMENVNETAKLWVASVTNATCGHTKDKRVLLTIDTSKPETPQYVWVDLGDGFGWVETLHCLTLPDG